MNPQVKKEVAMNKGKTIDMRRKEEVVMKTEVVMITGAALTTEAVMVKEVAEGKEGGGVAEVGDSERITNKKKGIMTTTILRRTR